jgi:hypothetical protein
VAAIVTPIR